MIYLIMVANLLQSPNFIVIKRTELVQIDPGDRDELNEDIGRYQDLIKVRFRDKFVLHPNEFVLGSTLEYISLPSTISGYVIGKSSLGRLGLIIATATYVHPGFKGCLTLELENIGEVPIVLYPGIRIGQLVLHTMKTEGQYDGIYKCPTYPEFSKFYQDKELDFWTGFKKKSNSSDDKEKSNSS